MYLAISDGERRIYINTDSVGSVVEETRGETPKVHIATPGHRLTVERTASGVHELLNWYAHMAEEGHRQALESIEGIEAGR